MGGDAPTEVPFAFNARPARDCDLVMKGGITSGVVYPPAVLVLQQRFRFRCIGGTSAGAIAAAVTAAAEFARESAGFERLDVIRRQLASPGFLLGLFKPSEGTAGAFGVLMDLFMTAEPLSPALPMGKRIATFVLRATRSLSRRFPGPTWLGGGVGALVGAIPAILILLGFGIGAPLSALAHSAWAAALAVIAGLGIGLGTWGGGLLSGASAFVRVFIDTLPNANSFGLCRGYTTKEDKTVLTSWLTDQIDVLAGRGVGDDDAPLTFADLASKKSPDGAGVDVVLRMVTSNLSHGQPYVFPREGNIFLFKEADMALLFPPRVVGYLKRAGGNGGLRLPEGYLYLPEGDALPVIVATRLSLSFPILLSAVRLYTIKAAAFGEYHRAEKDKQPFTFDPETHFQENWFSDGGISSNFPIHFFDAWLPSRPTFGINLADVPPEGKTQDNKIRRDQFSADARRDDGAGGDGEEQEGDTEIDDVFLPRPRDGGRGLPQWTPVKGLPGFLMSAFDTARNYRDTMQAMLPSYRERVVQVRLTKAEGGLNLAMDAETIRGIGDKGRRAGEKLADMDFAQHQWVRFKVLMAYLEKNVQRMQATFPNAAKYEALFDAQLAAQTTGIKDDKWYRAEDKEWCDRALERLGAVLELGGKWEKTFFGRNPPRPEAALRVTPPL